MKLVYSVEAVSDLVRLRQFVAEKDPQSAARIAKDIVNRVKLLRMFPEAGELVQQAPEPKAIRDIFIGNFIVRYSFHTEAVVILRIWHHYEDRSSGI